MLITPIKTGFRLTPGKSYVVYAVCFSKNRGKTFYITYGDDRSFPEPFWSEQFEIVDNRIPDDWGMAYFEDNIGDPTYVLSFKEMMDVEYYIKAHDSNLDTAEDKAIFEKYRIKYENLYKDFQNTNVDLKLEEY